MVNSVKPHYAFFITIPTGSVESAKIKHQVLN